MLMQRLTPLMLILLFLYGCASAPRQQSEWTIETQRPAVVEQEDASFSFFPFSLFEDEDEEVTEVEPDEPQFDSEPLAESEDLKGLLYAQLREWRSVRYQIGGMSKRGIDCSAFVHLTYRDKLGIDLPRDTRTQANAGLSIGQDQLKTGDLVFFHINRQTRHVGIYLEDRRFMHVSSKKGVTVSSLDNNYWAKRYWKAVRVPEVLVAMRMNEASLAN